MQPDLLTIQIPIELARYAVWQRSLVNKYETNQVIKALDTWLVLKAAAPGSYIQNWNQQKQYLSKICKCSETILRHRLQLLKKFFLLRHDRNSIRLCSWNSLANILEIDITKKFTFPYDISNKQRVCDWIIATEIRENQSRQAYQVIQKVNKNPELNMIITAAVIAAGADRSKLNDAGYFLQWMRILYQNDFIQASEIHAELTEVRPDTNRSVRGMANAWCCKALQTVSYWKAVLQRSGIIDISKLQIQSTGRVRNKHCKVLWIKKAQETMLCLCDQILVLQPWLITPEIRLAA